MRQAVVGGDSRQEQLHGRAVRLEWFTVGWNAIEAGVAIGAGLLAGSPALVGFGVDGNIEVTSGSVLLWRLRRAGANARAEERGHAERRALYLVSATFVALAAYIAYDAIGALIGRERPASSTVGLVLAVLSLLIMPILAYLKQRTGRALGSRALQADAAETWVCTYLSFALLVGVGLHAIFGWWWADPVGALAMLPVIFWQGWEAFREARKQ